ncbi:SRPBCC family protein [Ornithinimicrobium tianjinense]|uniref:Polyketide cyclase / dehydrase and lipid transport n=1 Tax=Ornithinimicrobium tianjinense TaxID=1195761 RepID=A0A917BR59_9MICO|nr:SRPBCC family protein [Ornithinimicrobium tianjinense]GGF53884.1 hypothetical protein GCM10011366_22150 [Ornithinimicrobium tianjinense]
MGVVDFELERVVRAPVDEVFGRLADIEGHNRWMPRKGSIRRRTEQTSPGDVVVGTTYVDRTVMGPTPGEVLELDPPRRIVYHWWIRGRSGKLLAEGWPGYTLEAVDERTTRVRHDSRLETHGPYRLMTPVLRRLAVRERSTTVDALRRSFEDEDLGF